jgi:hypothetical protein
MKPSPPFPAICGSAAGTTPSSPGGETLHSGAAGNHLIVCDFRNPDVISTCMTARSTGPLTRAIFHRFASRQLIRLLGVNRLPNLPAIPLAELALCCADLGQQRDRIETAIGLARPPLDGLGQLWVTTLTVRLRPEPIRSLRSGEAETCCRKRARTYTTVDRAVGVS